MPLLAWYQFTPSSPAGTLAFLSALVTWFITLRGIKEGEVIGKGTTKDNKDKTSHWPHVFHLESELVSVIGFKFHALGQNFPQKASLTIALLS